ncbi:MAG: hypothetical protein IPH44_14305 [Myxococcales bacterium]|nr:hypothetical protein [Myxococcales bacterium]
MRSSGDSASSIAHGLVERRDRGGDGARQRLVRAADLDDARLGRARATVVVVQLALAQPATARAAAHRRVGALVAADLPAHHQPRRVDQREERLAVRLGQEHVVDVAGRRGGDAVGVVEAVDDQPQPGRGDAAQAPGPKCTAGEVMARARNPAPARPPADGQLVAGRPSLAGARVVQSAP